MSAASHSNSSSLVVALDVDEVLTQYLAGYCAFHNEAYGTTLNVSDFHTYRLWEVTGSSRAEESAKVYSFHDTELFKELDVVPGAREGCSKLSSLPNVELHIVTSRHAEITEATKDWLATHFPGMFEESRIHVCNHWGTAEVRSVSKSDMCSAIGADVLVDDSLVYCAEAAAAGLRTLLFDLDGSYGWNKESVNDPLITRVNSWEEVVASVHDLAKDFSSESDSL